MDLLEQSLQKKEEPSDEKLIVMHGPLSELIYRALNGVFAKKGDESNYNLSIETLAQDSDLAAKVIENSEFDDINNNEVPDYVVFGVNKSEVEPETIVDVKNILTNKDTDTTLVLFTNDDSHNSKDLSDTAVASNKNGQYTNMSQALESYVQYHGGKIVRDMKTLIAFVSN